MALPILASWATAANYPAGSNLWSVQPIKQQPGYSYFTPGVPAAATELNWLFNQVTQGLSAAIASALDNWCPLVTGSSINAGENFEPLAVTFDKATNTWSAHIYNGTSSGIWAQSMTGGRTWVQRAASSENNPVVAIAAHNGNIVYWTNNTTNQVTLYSNAGGVTLTTVPDSIFRNAGVGWWSDAESLYYLYLIENSGSTFTSGTIVTTPDGTTLTQHGTLPTGWGSATNHYGALLHAQSPVFSLIAICGITPGTDTSHLGKVVSGVITDVTPSVLSGRVVTGLGYDASSGLWLLAAYDGTHTTVYSSGDGVTWSGALSTFTGRAANGLRAVGGIWAMILPTLNTTVSGMFRVWISADQGSTWHETYSDPIVLSTAVSLPHASGNNLLWVQASSATPGAQASLNAGLTG